MKITEKEFNVQTGEETITERELSENELLERNRFFAELQAKQAAEAEAAAAKAALLEKLGITEEEAKLLLA